MRLKGVFKEPMKEELGHRLSIEIPKKFRKGLALRFSPPEKGKKYSNEVKCPLCKEYIKEVLLE